MKRTLQGKILSLQHTQAVLESTTVLKAKEIKGESGVSTVWVVPKSTAVPKRGLRRVKSSTPITFQVGRIEASTPQPVLSGTPVPQRFIRVCLSCTPRASLAKLPDLSTP
ncbi:hypothetical protein JCGZ_15415 [Jatropha curcas]|uniref:Uncharacterized protein n=1 Tax=Jatropha curcas TaxID=180498 RepID=A0A067KI58_JATCU|nr:hypothetical protein JCGZ_15415 [Jatropha curcas]